MTTRFYKMSGSGNDFVFLDGREHSLEAWPAERIRCVCDRRQGVGADGLVLLAPEGSNAVRMIYFNSDGSRAGMCGNAALCSTRLAARLGLARAQGMVLETDAGSYESRSAGPGERAELRLATVPAPTPVAGLTATDGEQRVALGIVGVPHLVVLVDD